MKLLVFTDSRGVHRPAGSTHTMYPLQLAKTPGMEVVHYLCPFQWTTIPDFLKLVETREEFAPSRFDRVILHAGIVDHSPRPRSQATDKLYAPTEVTPAATVDQLFATRNFSGNKIINRKKSYYDHLFGLKSMEEHFSRPFETEYENEKTINMYSLEMMRDALIPRLAAIENLIFISSNNFCPGWQGDFPRPRPANINLIEDYSRLLCDSLGNTVNLHQWTSEQIKQYTCDNLHLTSDGNAWIYQRILEELGSRPRDYMKSRLTIGPPNRITRWPLNTEDDVESISSIKMTEPVELTADEVVHLRAKYANGNPIATLIIGVRFKEEDSSRLENLNFLLRWIEHFYPGLFDVLIIEQDSKPTEGFLDAVLGDYRYEFLYNPEAYNRGWLYNTAVKHMTNAAVVAFCDTDILPGGNFLDCVLDCYEQFDAVSPNRNLYYSTAEEKAAVIASGSYASLEVTEASLRNPTTMSGGMLVVNRERFVDLGGFEQYVGYGCEDRALDVTLLELTKPGRVRMDSLAYFHQHHPVHQSERAYFNDIYAHMVENYGCEYTPGLTAASHIHDRCNHADPARVAELAALRRPHIGDPNMYSKHSYVTVNGLPPICPGKLIPVAKPEPVFPLAAPDLDEYIKKEEFLGKYAGGWAPVVAGQSGDADTEELAFFYNRFKGKRCFIIGNGPSLNKINLSLLKNEYCFAVNSFYYKTRETGFRPTFFVVEDSSVIKENRDEIVAYEAPFKFFPSIYRSLHPKQPGTYFFKINRGFYEKASPNYAIPRFSTDVSKVAYCGQSVTYINLQLAFFMGFTEVFLIGMDFNYTIPQSHKRTGDVLLSDTDDPNHFHKDYFGKGKTWKDPKLDRVLMNYQMADMVYRCAGRKIYNATVGGKLEQFERVDFNGLFNGRDPRFKREPLDLTRPTPKVTSVPPSSVAKSTPGAKPAQVANTAKPEALATETTPNPSPGDSIKAANQLFDRGDYANCAMMCDRLFKVRNLRMYAHMAERARGRLTVSS